MKTLFVLLLALATAPRPNTTRGPIDMRGVVGVVPHAAGIDVYWLHTNELVTPVRSQLMRTTVANDGLSRLSVTLVRELEGWVTAVVDGRGANVQAMWRMSDRNDVRASPIVDGALKYPEGKLVAEYGLYPTMRCDAADCVVIRDLSGTLTATLLDADSNVAAAPFPLPAGFAPQQLTLDERGIFYVRHQLTEKRAALIRRDGSVQFDVHVADAEPVAFHAGPVAIAFNGSEYAVAFVDYAPKPDEVQVVTISEQGTVSAPVPLLQTEEVSSFANNVSSLSLLRNGAGYLLGGSYVSGRPFLLQFDGAFQLLDADRPAANPSGMHAAGSDVVISWGAPKPYVTILSADGRMSPALPVDPMPRRRSVR